MSDPGFARPDLCSVRTAGEQDELAEVVRSGFSAAGSPLGDDDPPVLMTSGIDRAIRLSTAVAVLAVAGTAQSKGPEYEARSQTVAELCRMAGADEAAIPQWIHEGRRRGEAAKLPLSSRPGSSATQTLSMSGIAWHCQPANVLNCGGH